MGVWALLGALVELFDDDDLLASLSPLQDDGDLSYGRLDGHLHD